MGAKGKTIEDAEEILQKLRCLYLNRWDVNLVKSILYVSML